MRDVFELDEESRANKSVSTLVRPIRFVPETKRVKDLMREMQQDSTHMVIVVDEYGNTAGLATMEDLVEVIVGEIRDEHEPGSDVTQEEDGSFVVSGSFDVARLNDLLEFKPQEEAESTTIGGLLSEWLGRVPKAGESVDRDGIHAEVLAGNELRVFCSGLESERQLPICRDRSGGANRSPRSSAIASGTRFGETLKT